MSRCPSQQAANLNGTITPGLFLYADGHWVVPSPDSVGKASESTRGICAVSSGQEFADLRKLCTGRSLPGIAPLIGMSEAVFVMADCQRSPRAPGGRALGFCSEAAIAMAENRGAKAMLACPGRRVLLSTTVFDVPCQYLIIWSNQTPCGVSAKRQSPLLAAAIGVVH